MAEKYFSGGFYLQTLKRLRIIGVSAAVIITAVNVLALVSQSLWYADVFAPVLIFAVALAPVFTFSAFSFLFSREQSDFYHALSLPRASVYISSAAAALTWTWGTVIISAFVNFEIRLFMGKYDILEMLSETSQYILASLVLVAFAAFAASFTGTKVSAFMTFIASCTLVRMLFYAFSEIYYHTVPILLGSSETLAFLEPDFFAPFNVLMHRAQDMRMSAGYALYNIAAALAVAAVGCVLFIRRKSDVAERPAQSRWLNNVISAAITLPIFAYAVPQLITGLTAAAERVYDGESYIRTGVILFVTAAAVFLIYQLITQKSIKKTLKASIFLLVPVLLCVIVTSVSLSVRVYIYSQKITEDDIEAVMPAESPFENSVVYNAIMRKGGINALHNYDDRGFASNPAAIALVCKCYSDTVTQDMGGKLGYQAERVTVKIRLKNKKVITRSLIIKDIKYINYLYDVAIGFDDSLTDGTEATVIAPVKWFAHKYSKDIADAARRDLALLTDEKRQKYLNGEIDSFYKIKYYGETYLFEDSDEFVIPYDFYETREMITRLINKNEEFTGSRIENRVYTGVVRLKPKVRLTADYPNSAFSLHVTACVTNGETGVEYMIDTSDRAKIAVLMKMIKEQQNLYDLNVHKAYALIEIQSGFSNGIVDTYVAAIPLDEDTAVFASSLI